MNVYTHKLTLLASNPSVLEAYLKTVLDGGTNKEVIRIYCDTRYGAVIENLVTIESIAPQIPELLSKLDDIYVSQYSLDVTFNKPTPLTNLQNTLNK